MTNSHKRVLVTGASKGIGKEIARAFVKEGYQVFGTSRNITTIADKLPEVQFVPLELSNNESIRNCFDQIQEIDILVNNAGQSQLGAVEEITIEKYEEMFRINLFGMIHLTQLFLPGMRKKKSGTIINIGSLGGRFALPYFSSYSSSKFAVMGFTQSLRYELFSFGIRVILIEPNDIKTTITPEFIAKGNSEYGHIAEKVREILLANMALADPPEMVANKVMKLIKTSKPNPFYAVGGTGPLLVFLKRLLPERLIERVIRKKYGL